MTPRIGSLCSGSGILDAAVAELLGARHAWFADNNSAAALVLAAHFPGVPNHGDIATVDWATVEPVDVLTAGFPCQDVSVAGVRAGLAPGTRTGVWTNVAHAIDVLRPALVVLENVEGLHSARAHSDVEPCAGCVGDDPGRVVLRASGAVLGTLASLGYDAQWVTVSASGVGAPHRRRRVFILAHPADAEGLGQRVGWPAGGLGVPAAAVSGAAGPDRLILLPTPVARDTGRSPQQHLAMRAETGHASVSSLAVAAVLLPTPRATDGTKGGPNQRGSSGDLMLPSAVMLLPTPRARDGKGCDPNPRDVDLNEAVGRLLPTPVASNGDARRGTPTTAVAAARFDSGRRNLDDAVALLPTPTVADSRGSRNATAGRRDPRPTTNIESWTLSDVAHGERWGEYAAAIARWEHILGRPAPDPTEPGKRGRPRLSPRFVEWMLGWPNGWVTDIAGLSRNDQLRIAGNGVVPQQATHALSLLLPVYESEVAA